MDQLTLAGRSIVGFAVHGNYIIFDLEDKAGKSSQWRFPLEKDAVLGDYLVKMHKGGL